ncbi:MAG: NAD(P)-dependent oxidoreductase [Chakrabartia sp.]
MHSLPLFVRLSGRPVILLGGGEAAAAKRRLLERAGAIIVGEDHNAALAIVAIEEDDEAIGVIARLKARGVLVNAVDRPTHCDFTLPAIVDRDPVLIAIGTGGASAGLAKALRQRLEAILPASLGILANNLSAARVAMKTRWPDAADRRRAIDGALDPGGALDLFKDETNVSAWVSGKGQPWLTGLQTLTIASNDPDDLTIKQARLLGQADHILYHPQIAQAILSRGRADATRTACTAPPTGPVSGLTLYLDGA